MKNLTAKMEELKRAAEMTPALKLDAFASAPMRLAMLALAHQQGMDLSRWLGEHLRATLPLGIPSDLHDQLFNEADGPLYAWRLRLLPDLERVKLPDSSPDLFFWSWIEAMSDEVHAAVADCQTPDAGVGKHRLWTGTLMAYSHLSKTDGKRDWFEKLEKLGPWREFFKVRPRHIRRIEELSTDAPNLDVATNFLLSQLRVAVRSKTGLRSAPRILLVGPPAAGKTWWAERVAAALELPTCHLSMPCVTANFELSGNTSQWGSAKPGKIVRAFLDSPTASPIIILDEIDKVLTRSDHPPGNTLLDLIERSTAIRWRDEFYDREFDVSAAVIIATANRASRIDAPLLSRFHRIDVRAPHPDQLPAMVRSVWRQYRKLRTDLALPPDLDERVVQRVAAKASDARSVMRLLDEAIGRAAMRGRRIRIVDDDLRQPAPASVVVEQDPGGPLH